MVTRFPRVLAMSLVLAALGPAANAAPAPAMEPAPAADPAPEARAAVPATPAAPAKRPTAPIAPSTRADRAAARGDVATVSDALATGGRDADPFAASPDRRADRPEPPPAVAIVVPVAFFLFVLFLVAVILLMGFRKERLRHETLRLMVERGAEIPVELLTGPRRKRSSDLRRGVILIACGLGLGLFLALVDRNAEGHAWSMGFIPALIGLGYLLVWRLEGAPRDGGGDVDGAGPGLPGRSRDLPGHPGAPRPGGQE